MPQGNVLEPLMRLRAFALVLVAACQGDDETDPVDTDVEVVPTWCETQGLTEVAFDAVGPYGERRHERADDFWGIDLEGVEWRLQDHWTGCETYVFIPDSVDGADGESIWAADLDQLLEWSPSNVHYFFVSRKRDEAAEASLAAMADQVDEVLGGLDEDEAAGWRARLHVVAETSSWVADVFRGIGKEGWAIDRAQNVRGIGSFSDVERYIGGNQWPYDPNLAYAALDAQMFNVDAEREARLAAEAATVLPMWTGEVISQYADLTVTLPSAAEMATFDTFEVDIDMRCPDPASPEFGNCGAWDYLADLHVKDGEQWIELGRMITTYHREARWVVDLTPMMAHLLAGGSRTFRWSWAPEWNVQPTETRLSLRFSNRGKGFAPRKATRVATGGAFTATYNDGRVPAEVPVSATAKRVELWALITGHGGDTKTGCSEFCNHQHEFTIAGVTHLQEYPEAGTEAGCRDNGIPAQMTPNQWGTWWLGRGGWCPGQPVLPYVIDLTADVPAGSTASVAYRGLYKKKTPPDTSGNVLMNAWLVEYE